MNVLSRPYIIYAEDVFVRELIYNKSGRGTQRHKQRHTDRRREGERGARSVR